MERGFSAFSPATSLILACALWGTATVFAKALLGSIGPITFLALQLIPSVAVLWTMMLVRGRPTARWSELRPLAMLGLLNPGLAYTLSMMGLAQTSASMTTLLWAAEPGLIVALAWLLLHEPVTGRMVLLTAAAAIGVFLVTGIVGGDGVITGNSQGGALILGGVTCCALYTVLSRRFALSVDPILIVAVQQTAGLAWTMAIWPFELLGGGGAAVDGLTLWQLLGGAITGLMYYGAAFWLYLHALRQVPASTAGLYLNLIPVFGVTTAYLALGEHLTPSQWAGGLIILISVVLLVRRTSTA